MIRQIGTGNLPEGKSSFWSRARTGYYDRDQMEIDGRGQLSHAGWRDSGWKSRSDSSA
jgi:hypothetical protein